MWTALQVHGTQAFAAAVGHKLALAERAWEGLSQIPDVEVGPRPDLCVVTFRVRGCSKPDEQLQEALVLWLREDADVFVTSTQFAGRTWLRLAVLCLQTRIADVDSALSAVARGAALLRQRREAVAAGQSPPGERPAAQAQADE